MSVVVIDGISASGKSLLLQALQRKALDQRPNFSTLVLTEHLTERFFENRNVSQTQVHLHVARILRVSDELKALQAESPFPEAGKRVTIMVERLFLTLMGRGLMTADFFSEHAALVESTAPQCVLLLVPPGQIEQRIAQTLTHRNTGWCAYIESLGGIERAAEHFERQQDKLLQLNELLSKYVPTHTIQVADTAELTRNAILEKFLAQFGAPLPIPARST